MNKIIPGPFGADHEGPQFMDHYKTMSTPLQQLMVAIVFLAILAGIVILKDMLRTSKEGEVQE